jgi:hypothetical protein
MMRQATLLFLTLLCSSLTQLTWGYGNICCLCENCSPATTPQEKGFWTDLYGLTSCPALDFTLLLETSVLKDTPECIALQSNWRTCCCTGNLNGCNFVEAEPTEPPAIAYPAGSYPWCDLCDGGVYPGNPFTITVVAYIPGNPTCADLYWLGRTGNIPGGVCAPLRSFMRMPCGCLEPGNPPGVNPSPSPPIAFQPPKNPQPDAKDNLRIGVLEITRGGGATGTHNNLRG